MRDRQIERDRKTLCGCIELLKEMTDAFSDEMERNDIGIEMKFFTSYSNIVRKLFPDEVKDHSAADYCDELDVDAYDNVVFKAREGTGNDE